MSKKELEGVLHRMNIKFMIIWTFFEEYRPQKRGVGRFNPELFWHESYFFLRRRLRLASAVSTTPTDILWLRGGCCVRGLKLCSCFRFGVWREALLENAGLDCRPIQALPPHPEYLQPSNHLVHAAIPILITKLKKSSFFNTIFFY